MASTTLQDPFDQAVSAVLAVAEHRSYAKAGRALGLSRTVTARRVASFERYLGIGMLFASVVDGKTVHLTTRGRAALPAVRILHSAIGTLRRATELVATPPVREP